jgi:hypothetical protein
MWAPGFNPLWVEMPPPPQQEVVLLDEDSCILKKIVPKNEG